VDRFLKDYFVFSEKEYTSLTKRKMRQQLRTFAPGMLLISLFRWAIFVRISLYLALNFNKNYLICIPIFAEKIYVSFFKETQKIFRVASAIFRSGCNMQKRPTYEKSQPIRTGFNTLTK